MGGIQATDKLPVFNEQETVDLVSGSTVHFLSESRPRAQTETHILKAAWNVIRFSFRLHLCTLYFKDCIRHLLLY